MKKDINIEKILPRIIELYRLLRDNKIKRKDILDELNITCHTFYKILKDNKISINKNKSNWIKENQHLIIKDIKSGLSASEIKGKYRISYQSIKRIEINNNLKCINYNEKKTRYYNNIIKDYEECKLTLSEICKKYNICEKTIYRALKKKKVDLRGWEIRKNRPDLKCHFKGTNLYEYWGKKFGKKMADEKYNHWIQQKSMASKGERNGMYGSICSLGKGIGDGYSGWYKNFYFRSFKEL